MAAQYYAYVHQGMFIQKLAKREDMMWYLWDKEKGEWINKPEMARSSFRFTHIEEAEAEAIQQAMSEGKAELLWKDYIERL